MLTIFFRKMVLRAIWRHFNTLVLKCRFWTDLENDRPVGRSFSRNLDFEDLIFEPKDGAKFSLWLNLDEIGYFQEIFDFLKNGRI